VAETHGSGAGNQTHFASIVDYDELRSAETG